MRGLTTEGARVVDALGRLADRMNGHASVRGDSLELLLEQLDDKRVKLASMPSIWPARGWLTSRFGARVSPFTGRRQMHAGIDIASRAGTPIIAPAQGRVSYVGRKGPMGNTLILDHGFGVKTIYGHTEAIHVKPGQSVERGQEIAAIGSTGRSTGPHLHYVVEINGKPRNPLDYIFD
jgi:murein DD-endopeptidase MepM/ murein hydrolase activator NlpD